MMAEMTPLQMATRDELVQELASRCVSMLLVTARDRNGSESDNACCMETLWHGCSIMEIVGMAEYARHEAMKIAKGHLTSRTEDTEN